MDQSKELENGSIGKLLLKFSIPAVIGMLVNAMYSIVDRIFVGRGVGSLALSGVGVTFPITNIIMAVGMLVGTGAAAVVSIKLGEKKPKRAEKIIGNAFLLSIILSIAVSLIGIIFLEPILTVLGATPDIMPYAKQFGTIILIGAVFQNVGFGINPIIRSEGDPKTAMFTMLIGALLNTIINPMLIFGFKLGVIGSALATVISQTVCTVWITFYFTKGKSHLKLRRTNMRLEKSVIREIVAIGMSPFAMQVAASLVTVTLNKSLAMYGGEIAIGALALINSIAMLILMPMLGINQGAQPIIGYNYGAKNIERVKRTLLYSALAAGMVSIIGFVIVHLFPVQIIRIFNNDTELIKIGSNGLSIMLMMFGFVGFQTAIVNYFQAVGKAKYSMFLSLLRQVLLLIPLTIILPHFFQLNGVWMAAPASDFISTMISFAFIAFELRSLNRLNKSEEIDSEDMEILKAINS